MRWSDEITLIAINEPVEITNAHGFENTAEETRITVFANKKSVGNAEFYRAAQAGYVTELKFDVMTADYNGQVWVEYDSVRYKVLRTYVSKSGETTELTLTNIKSGGVDTG